MLSQPTHIKSYYYQVDSVKNRLKKRKAIVAEGVADLARLSTYTHGSVIQNDYGTFFTSGNTSTAQYNGHDSVGTSNHLVGAREIDQHSSNISSP